jgi:hypothetical protein
MAGCPEGITEFWAISIHAPSSWKGDLRRRGHAAVMTFNPRPSSWRGRYHRAPLAVERGTMARRRHRVARPIVTFENLEDWATQLPRHEPFVEPIRRLAPLAQLAITKIMGKQWAELHLSHGGQFSDWLLPRVNDVAGFTLRQYRFVHMAEVLYELQSQPEIEHHLKPMQKEKVADYFFELEAAWWLQRNGARVMLRGERDYPPYDADVLLNGTFRAAAEFKCKLEHGQFNGERIRKGLLKARDKQLPWDDRFSLVVMQLPTDWTAANVSIPEAVKESVYSVFGCETKPWAVLFYWVTWEPGGDWQGNAVYNHALIVTRPRATSRGGLRRERGRGWRRAFLGRGVPLSVTARASWPASGERRGHRRRAPDAQRACGRAGAP